MQRATRHHGRPLPRCCLLLAALCVMASTPLSFDELERMPRSALEHLAWDLLHENNATRSDTNTARVSHSSQTLASKESRVDHVVQRRALSSSELKNQATVLNELFDATGGPGWTHTWYWPFRNPCGDDPTWFGVQCDGDVVVALTLPNNNLIGTIPSSLGLLTSLTSIDLQLNALSGTIPSELSQLSSLVELKLSFNELTGTLPDELSLLSELTTLHMAHNFLSGTLPSLWSTGFPVITDFQLWTNNLTGTLPDSWSALSTLSKLDIDTNNLVGTLPPSWSTLSNLVELALFRNNIDGTIPSTWVTFTELQQLWIYDNELSGTLPNEWSLLTSLVSLQLSNNNFAGTLPSSWSSLVNLEKLWVDRNDFLIGTLPASWANLVKLTGLRLGHNSLTGTLPSSWSNLTQLNHLWLEENTIDGTLPESWGYPSALSQLRQLKLGNNSIEGPLPTSWTVQQNGMPSLSQFDMSFNNLAFDVELAWATNANYLDLSGNNLYGTLPFLSMPLSQPSYQSMLFLSLADNPHINGRLTGCNWVGGCALLSLNISGTSVSGDIPNVWRHCFPHIQMLDVRDTAMLGHAVLDGSSNFLKVGHSLVNGTAHGEGLKKCPILEPKSQQSRISVPTDLAFFNISWCPCADRTYGTNGACHACVWASLDCTNGSRVLLLPGYWASASAFYEGRGHQLHPARCPEERCCSNSDGSGCEVHSICAAANRSGVLCGRCLPRHSAAYASETCVPDEECTYGPLVFFGLTVAALAYVLFLVIISADDQMDYYDSLTDGWKQWLGIDSAITELAFFYQVVPILVSPYTKEVLGRQASLITQSVVSVLNFSVQKGSSGFCLYPGMTAVSTTAFHFVLPCLFLFWLIVLALGGVLYRHKYPPNASQPQHVVIPTYAESAEELKAVMAHAIGEPGFRSWHVRGRHYYALNILSQLTFVTTYKTALALVRCATVIDGADLTSSLRLFIDGEQACLASAWQIALLVLAIALTAFPPWRFWASGRAWGVGMASFFAPDRLLYHRKCVGWPGVLLLQRLAYVTIDTFASDRLVLRAWLNGLLSAIGALVVTFTLPFRRFAANVVAALIHALLVLLALPAIANAQLIATGSNFDRTSDASIGPTMALLSEIFIAIPLAWLVAVVSLRAMLFIQNFLERRNGKGLKETGEVELL